MHSAVYIMLSPNIYCNFILKLCTCMYRNAYILCTAVCTICTYVTYDAYVVTSFLNHFTELEEGDVANEYAKNYRQSEEYNRLQEELKPILEEARKNPVGAAPDFANNFFWQVQHKIRCSCFMKEPPLSGT